MIAMAAAVIPTSVGTDGFLSTGPLQISVVNICLWIKVTRPLSTNRTAIETPKRATDAAIPFLDINASADKNNKAEIHSAIIIAPLPCR